MAPLDLRAHLPWFRYLIFCNQTQNFHIEAKKNGRHDIFSTRHCIAHIQNTHMYSYRIASKSNPLWKCCLLLNVIFFFKKNIGSISCSVAQLFYSKRCTEITTHWWDSVGETHPFPKGHRKNTIFYDGLAE